MITPQYLEEIMEASEQVTSKLQNELVKMIAKRIVDDFKDGNEIMMPSAISDYKKLLHTGLVEEDAIKLIERYLPKIKKEVRKIFMKSANEIAKYNDDVARNIIEFEGIKIDAPYWDYNNLPGTAEALHMTPYEIRAMESAYRRTMGEVRNMARTTANACQTAYIDACDNAYTQVIAGVSPSKATINAIKDMSKQGISIVRYGGRSERVEVAIARAVRTGVNQANADISLTRCAEMGCNYVKASAHLGARVTKVDDYTNHSWWQGKIYKLDWSNDILAGYEIDRTILEEDFAYLNRINEINTGRPTKDYPDFVETCGYGDIQGICGINCRHTFSPAYPFNDMDDEEDIDKDANEKRFKAEQSARAMAREIRATKRELESLKAIKDANDEVYEEIIRTQDKLDRQCEKYRQYCRDNRLSMSNVFTQI